MARKPLSNTSRNTPQFRLPAGTIADSSRWQRLLLEGTTMAPTRLMVAIVLALCPIPAAAQQHEWQRYVVNETGASVDLPRDIFSREAGKPESGAGAKFLTSDGRANLTIQSIGNDANDTPQA